MKRALLMLSILFVILTFCGVGYVLSTGGQANAGYSVVPMVIAIAFIAAYRKNGGTK